MPDPDDTWPGRPGGGSVRAPSVPHGAGRPGPFVYAVEGVDQLFQLCAGLKRFRRTGGETAFRDPASSLYRFGNGYRLVIYPGFVTPRGMSGMLSEFGKLVGEGDAAAAFTAEHGQPLAIGDAVEQLGRCS